MFKFKSLAVGLALSMGATSAMATFVLDGSATVEAAAVIKVASDGLPAGTVTSGSTSYSLVDMGNGVLDIDAPIGVGVSENAKIFVRYDLTNAFFNTAPALTVSNSAAGAATTIALGGTTGSNFTVFQVTASNAIVQATRLFMEPQDLGADFASGSTSITQTVFETLTAAQANTTPLTTESASLISYQSGITVGYTATGNVADVETDFKDFTATSAGRVSANLASLGQILITPAAATFTGTGNGQTQVTKANIYVSASSTVTITGDFSAGSLGLSATAACGTLTAITPNAAKTASTAVTAASIELKSFLCYTTVDTPTQTFIPKTTYTVAIAFDDVATREAGIVSSAGTLGTITHNGTTVEIPYLTTFADYNQRIIMVNRGSATAAYNITFQVEDGTTAVAGTAASGTIPAGGVLNVKASDVVTLTGKTRAAATMTIVAADAKISIATSQVNLSDKSTDTISLN